MASLLVGSCAREPAAVAPTSGRGSGGEPIRITGAGFRAHGPPVVYVGQRSAKAVVVESDTLITALTPEADASGLVDVVIQFADGEVATYPGAYTYGERTVVLRAGGEL